MVPPRSRGCTPEAAQRPFRTTDHGSPALAGMHPRRGGCIHECPGSPALAGMHPPVLVDALNIAWFPRARGDAPCGRAMTSRLRRVPRARCTRCGHSAITAKVPPRSRGCTRVGPCKSALDGRWFPRARGDAPIASTCAASTTSSPAARGDAPTRVGDALRPRRVPPRSRGCTRSSIDARCP
jgi:hypothetical protein